MSVEGCTIIVKRLGPELFRATCPMFPDCQAVAVSEEAARRALEENLERLLRERAERMLSSSCEEDTAP